MLSSISLMRNLCSISPFASLFSSSLSMPLSLLSPLPSSRTTPVLPFPCPSYSLHISSVSQYINNNNPLSVPFPPQIQTWPIKSDGSPINLLYSQRLPLTIIQFMITIRSVGFLLLLSALQAANNCPNPTLIVPQDFLSGVFNKTFTMATHQVQLRAFLTNPTMETARTYITTQSDYLVTLWVFAGLSFALLFAGCLQICCFNCCRTKKCGNKINFRTYTPSSVSCSVYLFMFFSILLVGITIAAFIVSSDLLANLNDTTCDITATFNYLFDGTPQGYTPQWSGANNFNGFASQISINFPNAMPTLNTLFQSSQFSLLAGANSSLYTAATTYTCPSSLATTAVSCPFNDPTKCASSSTTQIPVFSQNYCNSNISSSSVSLIQNEQNTNSTTWKSNLNALQQSISTVTSNPINFDNLVSETSTLSSSIQILKPSLSSTIDSVNNNFNQAKLGSYIVYSAIIAIGLLAFLSSCCVFCTRNFKCRYLLYPLWILFSFLAMLFFLASSVLLFGSFTTFGSCRAYEYYTTSSQGFQSISFYNSSQMLQILNTCYKNNMNNTANIFNTFNQTTNLPTIEQIKTNFYAALPASTFTTVANNITNTLTGYALNPNSVGFVGASASQTPQAALTSLNSQFNGSTPCGIAGTTFQYNPNQCYPNVIGQTSSPCILISDSSAATVNSNSTYSCVNSPFQSLLTYGKDVQTLTNSYINDAGLQGYRNGYFNYYEAVSTFLNSNVQLLFNSFLQPYQSLLVGSSCSFLTDSLNSLVISSCNRDFPQMYAISCLVTAMAACFFFLMILAYFLTTRLQFYAFLNGDLSNYNEELSESQQQKTIQIEMADLTARSNRKQLLPQ